MKRTKAWKVFTLLCLCFMLAGSVGITAQAAQSSQKTQTRWQKLLEKYRNKNNTNRLIFVKYRGGSRATLVMYKKTGTTGNYKWKKILSCQAYTGKNGINKIREGDKKTPTGTFWITSAFGIRKNPGTSLPYTRLNKYLYWSAEKDTYNTMVDSRTLGRTWISGEHLIDYKPAYNYAMVIGYNRKCVYQKGSAIFLHVSSGYSYTAGCVSVSQASMKKILKNSTRKTRICIYPYK